MVALAPSSSSSSAKSALQKEITTVMLGPPPSRAERMEFEAEWRGIYSRTKQSHLCEKGQLLTGFGRTEPFEMTKNAPTCASKKLLD
jgi:hypothetical protein